MTIAVETYLVVALAFAVFSAVVALGSSLVLGIGFERLRAGFEVIKNQTGFFSDSIHKLDNRVDTVEKQGRYFFETIHKLEEQQKPVQPKEEIKEIQQITVSSRDISDAEPLPEESPLWAGTSENELMFH